MCALVDMAVYPALFNQYLAFFVPELGDGARFAIALGIIWISAAVNLRGALDVGRVSTVAGLFVLAGFAAVALAALPNATHLPWLPFAKPGESSADGLAVALSIALWNYIGWDNSSTVQGEVADASCTYPRALALGGRLKTQRWTVDNRPTGGAGTGVVLRFMLVSCKEEVVESLVRQLLGPHLSTWAWWRSRSPARRLARVERAVILTPSRQ
jgi:amino acid transporter